MMWINILLLCTGLNGSGSLYWEFVRAANAQGCRVYNDYYMACPGVNPPPGAIEIPLDAVEVIAPNLSPRKKA